jgi:hypothetical protein
MKQKLNVKLLRRIQKYIMEEPRRFLMDAWGIKARSQKEWKRKTEYCEGQPKFEDASDNMPPCGTAACIAGTANLLTGGKKLSADVRAAKQIGLSKLQAENLFYKFNWPARFEVRYDSAKTPKARAKIACQRIDHLIKKGE